MKPGKFSYNYGSVFEILQSYVVLEGHLLFDGNIGNKGAVIVLMQDSAIFLRKGLRAYFVNNTVLSFGGAIYAANENYKEALCTFQLFSSMDYKNISLTFINNTAGLAGNTVYSRNLYDCYTVRYGRFNHSVLVKMYKLMFKNISLYGIKSKATFFQPCTKKSCMKFTQEDQYIYQYLSLIKIIASHMKF